jgi:glycosyltransferase involved in cell wall biosynthesis
MTSANSTLSGAASPSPWSAEPAGLPERLRSNPEYMPGTGVGLTGCHRGTRRVLYVAYLFPPVGGAGVQRTAKFVKYLPQFGWLPTVLTVANPSVPLFDRSLVDDVPEGTEVRRARTWEPSYSLKSVVSAGGTCSRGWSVGRLARSLFRRLTSSLLQPDPQVLWVPAAIREGRRILRETDHAAIVVTAPPFSSFLVGAALSRASGLPLVLDYRDEWTLSSAYWENRRLGPLSCGVQGFMQRRVVRAARALVATTRLSAKALEAVRDRAGSKACVSWIYNGFDPDDFPPAKDAPRRTGEAYRLTYVGTLWNLTSVAPLVSAVRGLAERRPDLAAHLELVFAGRRTGEQQQLFDGLRSLPCRLTEHPYVDHGEAVELLRSAEGLCVLLSDLPGAERVVPAKIFEYMAARRPVLAVAPPGELWDLLRDHPGARLFHPRDVEGIAAYLQQQVERHRAGREADLRGWSAEQYSRPHQAAQLASLLESLAERAGGRRSRTKRFLPW